MKKMIDLLTREMEAAFVAAGYDACLGRVTLSNRPDLCEYQCNGAMDIKIYALVAICERLQPNFNRLFQLYLFLWSCHDV